MNKQLKGAILTINGGVFWGLSGSVGQYLFTVQRMDSRWLVPIRLFVSGVILLAFGAIKYGSRVLSPWRGRRNLIELLIYGVAGVSMSQFFYFATIQYSSAGIGTILQDLSPVMVLLCVCAASRRLPKAREAFAIILALAGVFLIMTHGEIGTLAVPIRALVTGILCAACVTIYNTVPKRLMRSFPISILQAWAFLCGGTFLAIVFRVWQYRYVPNAAGLAGIATVILLGNIFAFTSYMTGLNLIGAEKAILYGFSEPVSAALISTLFLNSPFTLWDAAGFAAVFLMMILISIRPKKPTRPDNTPDP